MDGSGAWAERVLDAIAHPQPKPLVIVHEAAPVQPDPALWLLGASLCIVVLLAAILWLWGGRMTSNSNFSLAVSFLTDFTISAGGCLTTAMVATGSTVVPSVPVIIFSIVTGLVAAARRVQAILEPSPTTTKTTETTPTPVGPKTVTTEMSTTAPVIVPEPAPPMLPAPTAAGHWELREGVPVWVAKPLVLLLLTLLLAGCLPPGPR